MVMRITSLLLALLAPLPLSAQPMCHPEQPAAVLPDCMVGTWTGTSDVLGAMARGLSPTGIGPEDRIETDMPGGISATIFADGFMISDPWTGTVAVTTADGAGDMAIGVQTDRLLGWMWPDGPEGRYLNCADTATGNSIISISSAEMTTTFDTADVEAAQELTESTVTCAGDVLTIDVEMPDPVGRITSTYKRAPDDPRAESLRALAKGN